MDLSAGAAAGGDIESAISTYEQLLFYNPKLSQTRFQLGVLYYELGSYDMARGYLETALQMPDVTPDLQQKIADLLDLVLGASTARVVARGCVGVAGVAAAPCRGLPKDCSGSK